MKQLNISLRLSSLASLLRSKCRSALAAKSMRRRLNARWTAGEGLESRELMSVNPIAQPQMMQEQGPVSYPAVEGDPQVGPSGQVSQQSATFGPVGDLSPKIPQASGTGESSSGWTTFDPNDQIREAIRVGRVYTQVTNTGAIDNAQDVDMYMIQVAAGERFTFDTDTSYGFDSVIRLFNSSGRQIAMNDDGAAPGERSSRESYLDYVFSSPGSYYLGISGYGNSNYSAVTGTGDSNGRTGDYSVTVKKEYSIGPGGGFDVESNNSMSSADNLGYFGPGFHSRTFYGRTGSGLDTQDWSKIEFGGRPSGTIQLTGLYQDLDIRLYDNRGRVVKSSLKGGTRTDTISLSGLSAGTYYIRISPGVSGAVSSYALRFGFWV